MIACTMKPRIRDWVGNILTEGRGIKMSRKKNKGKKQSTEDWMTFNENGGNPTLALSGELGLLDVPLLGDALWKFLRSHKNATLDLDLRAVPSIGDSRIINVFIRAHRGAERRKIQLNLLEANSAVKSAFEAVRVSDIFFS